MKDIQDVKRKLEDLVNSRKKEFALGPIEKLMCRGLGVKTLDLKGGSARKYHHEALTLHGKTGHFTVHTISGRHKKKPMIRKLDYKNFLYPNLALIIALIEKGEWKNEEDQES